MRHDNRTEIYMPFGLEVLVKQRTHEGECLCLARFSSCHFVSTGVTMKLRTEQDKLDALHVIEM